MEPRAALARVLRAAGADPAAAGRVDLAGADPVLPSVFALGTAGMAVLGAAGVAADDCWRARGGGPQRIAIDARRAAFALRTDRHVRLDGKPPQSPWSPISGFYRTGDGRWVQFHCNFPHHRDGVLRRLGAAEDRADVARLVAGWDAPALEDALAADGMCAAMLRTRDEWRAHPQGEAVAALPVIAVERIGDAPSRPVGDGTTAAGRPLAGVRVLDLTRVIAGPVAGRTLAEHGATVMRLSAPHLPFVATLLLDTGHGKLNASVNLDTEDGRDRLRALVADADVFVQSYRPGALAARGFGADQLAALRPGIVHVALSAYGGVGPWGVRRGFDTLVQTASGLAAEESAARESVTRTEGSPRHLPAQALDYASGYLAACGAMVALARRAREGGSWSVRVSLAGTAGWLDGLGRVDPAVAHAIPDPTNEALADLLTETASPFGRIRNLMPALEMSQTPPRWTLPPSELGSHPAMWPA